MTMAHVQHYIQLTRITVYPSALEPWSTHIVRNSTNQNKLICFFPTNPMRYSVYSNINFLLSALALHDLFNFVADRNEIFVNSSTWELCHRALSVAEAYTYKSVKCIKYRKWLPYTITANITGPLGLKHLIYQRLFEQLQHELMFLWHF